MSERTETRYSGKLLEITASQAKNLDERGVPKQLGRQFRKVEISGYDKETHTVTMAVSSSTPVERYYGQEILSHEKGALRDGRLKGGIALLFNHNYDQHLGRSQSYEFGDPLHVTCRFGTNPLALEKEGDVESKILVDVSIGYLVHEWEITEDKNGVRTYLAVDWELLEVSLVTVPADPTVGVGRDAKDAVPVKVRSFRKLDDEDESDDEEDDDPDDDDEDGEKKRAASDDEGDDEDEDDEDERSAAESQTSSEAQPTQQRTPTMAEAADDLKAKNEQRVAKLKSFRTDYPKHFSEEALNSAIALDVPVEAVASRIQTSIMDAAERTNVQTLGEEVFSGMSERERKAYSIRNVYAAAVNQVRSGAFKDKGAEAGFEREVSDTLRKKADERGITGVGAGILVPSPSTRGFGPTPQQRAIASGGNAGNVTNFTTVETDVIELLRSRTAVLALGARMLTGLHGAIKMPRQNATASSSWLNEGSGVTNSDPGLDAITMAPKRLSIMNSYFLDFLAQSSLDVEGFLAGDRQKVLARSLDTAVIAGSGVAPVPLGFMNQTGLSAVLAGKAVANDGTVTAGTGGKRWTYEDANAMEATISTANADDLGTIGWLGTPKLRAAARSTPVLPGTASGVVFPSSKVGANGIQEGPLGYNTLITSNPVLTGFTANSVNNLHAWILGVWDQIMIGDWGLSEVIADPYTGAASALWKIYEHAFYDTNVRHLDAFVACTSALPS